MVIRDENNKVVILLSKKDILDYVFEKCGVEVGLQVEEQFNQADEAFDQDCCEGCQVLDDKYNEIAALESVIDNLEEDMQKQKENYIKYLKDKRYFAAAKALQDLDEGV